MTEKMTGRALSFGPAAAHYDAIRPTYPSAAISWVLGDALTEPQATHTLVDLGAGTGLLTRVILNVTGAPESGTTVVPVEPDAQMRERLAQVTPSVTPVAGSAEAIPRADGSVDAVLAGQSYHWFDKDKAHAEIARVLRPGGVFAPIWNIRDESEAWVAEYSRLIDDDGPNDHHGLIANPSFGISFGPVATETFRHSVTMDADGLIALLASRSYYLTTTAEVRARLESAIRGLTETLPPTFEMPYVTYCYRAVRL